MCSDALGYIVDHKIEINPTNMNDVDVVLNHDNLQYLCHDCHNKKHGYFKRTGVVFDSNGDPIGRY